jgi:Putative transposase
MGRLCAQVEGYNLQAATRIGANDREGLERMARYLARPPIATERLSQRDDGRLELRLKRPWRDGTTAFLFTPHELIERLVAQVPRPRAHLTRYHGVLAPAFAARAQIVPGGNGREADAARAAKPDEVEGAKKPRRRGRFPWASLIWRVFLKDVLECARCSGRMEIVAAVTSPAGVLRILEHMGLSSVVPPVHLPRPPPQAELPFDVSGFEPDPPAPDDFDA